MAKYEELYEIARKLASETEAFLDIKGPGAGNRATNWFVTSLGRLASEKFGEDHSEKNICGPNSLAVDFYFPCDGVIVEVALGLKNPNTEYEKDILKAIMAKELGNKVEKLVFITKPGGLKKCNQPGRTAIRHWLASSNEIGIEIMEL